MNEVMLQRSQLSEQLKKETNENRRLQAIVEEHEQLLVQYSTQRESYDGLSKEYQQLMSAHDDKCAK
jgi:IS4 transposase